jgi:lipoprotein NlpI
MRSCTCALSLLMTAWPVLAPEARGEPADDLLAQAKAALDRGQAARAIDLAGKAVQRQPKRARAHLLLGRAHALAGKHREAVADFSEALTLDPRLAEALHLRGCEQFKLGRATESLADFDRYLELKPGARPRHWQRGISCYYAGKFAEGQRQFEAYQDVDGNDVENVVWRYLCMARRVGRAKARADMLPVGEDRRVPLKEVYALFLGRLKPADVLTAARAGSPRPEELARRLFYADLYLGLYYDSEGDKRQALDHLTRAADDHGVGGYMGDVARVHRDLLRKESARPPSQP